MRWLINGSVSPISLKGTINGLSTVSGTVSCPSAARSGRSASDRPMCPRCNPWPTSPPVMGSWACSRRGRRDGEEGLQLAETMADPSSLMWASYGLGLVGLCQGDLPRALPLLERALGICQDADLRLFVPRVTAALGTALLLAGRVADAVALLTPMLEQTRAADLTVFQALCYLPLGEAQLLAGHVEEAHALARADAGARPGAPGAWQSGLCPAAPRRHCSPA